MARTDFFFGVSVAMIIMALVVFFSGIAISYSEELSSTTRIVLGILSAVFASSYLIFYFAYSQDMAAAALVSNRAFAEKARYVSKTATESFDSYLNRVDKVSSSQLLPVINPEPADTATPLPLTNFSK